MYIAFIVKIPRMRVHAYITIYNVLRYILCNKYAAYNTRGLPRVRPALTDNTGQTTTFALYIGEKGDKNMYLLIVREKDNEGAPAEILDVKIVPEKDLDRYAQRAAELNKSNKRRNYAVEKHDDNSLVAFLASDRQYDMDKYAALANMIRSDIDRLSGGVEILCSYYREAAQSTAASDSPAETPCEQPRE